MTRNKKPDSLSEEEIAELKQIVDNILGPTEPPELPVLGAAKPIPSLPGLPVLGGDPA